MGRGDMGHQEKSISYFFLFGMIIHFDCNNFYASRELLFRPDLKDRPVVVANGNDAGGGIILALNQHAKQLGLKRGNPLFQVRQILERHQVSVFQANLEKYSSISKRIMQVVVEQDILQHFTQYSIDEFFGEMPLDDETELTYYISQVRKAITQGLGIPVSCGAAETYTLAKTATWFAKHYPAYRGTCIISPQKREAALRILPAKEIWGIGRRSIEKLQYHGIQTAFDFVQKKESFIQRLFTSSGVNTWKELKGIRSINIDKLPQQRSIMHSRTFDRHISDLEQLRNYLSNYASAAARKLRDQHSVCHTLTVLLRTNRHRPDLPQYANSINVELPISTDDTRLILRAALHGLEQIFKPHYAYKKMGIILQDITDNKAVEQDLFFSQQHDINKSRRLMSAIDTINNRFGTNKVKMAIQDNGKSSSNVLTNIQPFKNELSNLDDIIQIK